MIERGYVTAFLSAFLFAVGLGVGGMTDPGKVQGFLDFAGTWQPALAGVMGGAVMTYLVLHRLILRAHRPVFHDAFSLPTKRQLDPRLLGGAAIFGVGWGLVGICPGPAIAVFGAGAGFPEIAAFVAAMFVGFLAVPSPKKSQSQVELEVPGGSVSSSAS